MLTVNCPNCGKQTQYEGNEFRPFCSERCKLIDFGDWATERYSVPLQDETLSEEDLARIEQSVKGRSEDK